MLTFAKRASHTKKKRLKELMITYVIFYSHLTFWTHIILGKPFEFYKQIDITDLHNYLKGNTTNIQEIVIGTIFRNMHIYFGSNPAEELFKFKPHKRSWILQSIKRFGDYYFRKYNNSEVSNLIREIIEWYDLNKDLYERSHIPCI